MPRQKGNPAPGGQSAQKNPPPMTDLHRQALLVIRAGHVTAPVLAREMRLSVRLAQALLEDLAEAGGVVAVVPRRTRN